MHDYRILGSLEVLEGDRAVALGGARCRAVLAVLVISANRPVSVGRLIDEVWGDPSPPTAGNVVQGHVSDLRRALGRDAIETRGDAYVLHVARGSRDVDRFEELATGGSRALADGRAQEASAAFAEALALWRGPALAEIAEGGLLVAEALRLDEMRLHALERRIEADLACARDAELVESCAHSWRSIPCASRCGRTSPWPCTGQGATSRRSTSCARPGYRWPTSSASTPAPGCRSSSAQSCVHDPALAAPAGAALRRRAAPLPAVDYGRTARRRAARRADRAGRPPRRPQRPRAARDCARR